jgi:hypothetical protein
MIRNKHGIAEMTAAEPRSGVRRSARNPTAQSNRGLHLQPLSQDSAVSILSLRVTGSELPAATQREDVNSRISARTRTPRDARNVKKQRCNVPSPLFCRTRAKGQRHNCKHFEGSMPRRLANEGQSEWLYSFLSDVWHARMTVRLGPASCNLQVLIIVANGDLAR